MQISGNGFLKNAQKTFYRILEGSFWLFDSESHQGVKITVPLM
jgi:hypothetical protein